DMGARHPTSEELSRVRNHLIDCIDPYERYPAARFRADALAAIAEIRARGGLPVVVGGTGLYVRALLKGLDPAPPADLALRAALDRDAEAGGPGALHARLRALDPAAAQRLHPNDRVRIVRALEVRVAGDHPSARGARPQAAARAATLNVAASWRSRVTARRLLMGGLRQERALLNRRLAGRASRMLARGMMDEVRGLLALGYDDTAPAMAGIGYRQLANVVRGRLDLEEALRLMIRDTTRYAKRQMTWFARD